MADELKIVVAAFPENIYVEGKYFVELMLSKGGFGKIAGDEFYGAFIYIFCIAFFCLLYGWCGAVDSGDAARVKAVCNLFGQDAIAATDFQYLIFGRGRKDGQRPQESFVDLHIECPARSAGH